MEKEIARAARWCGVCLVISSVILAIALYSASKRIAGARQAVNVSFPNDITVRTGGQLRLAPVQLYHGQSGGGPLEIRLRQDEGSAGSR
jgi:hypothetical protein